MNDKPVQSPFTLLLPLTDKSARDLVPRLKELQASASAGFDATGIVHYARTFVRPGTNLLEFCTTYDGKYEDFITTALAQPAIAGLINALIEGVDVSQVPAGVPKPKDILPVEQNVQAAMQFMSHYNATADPTQFAWYANYPKLTVQQMKEIFGDGIGHGRAPVSHPLSLMVPLSPAGKKNLGGRWLSWLQAKLAEGLNQLAIVHFVRLYFLPGTDVLAIVTVYDTSFDNYIGEFVANEIVAQTFNIFVTFIQDPNAPDTVPTPWDSWPVDKHAQPFIDLLRYYDATSQPREKDYGWYSAYPALTVKQIQKTAGPARAGVFKEKIPWYAKLIYLFKELVGILPKNGPPRPTGRAQ